MDKFTESERLESALAIACIHLGYDDDALPLWRRDTSTGFSVLTWRGAMEMAKTFDIKFEIVSSHRSLMNRDRITKHAYSVIVSATLTDGWKGMERKMTGAASSQFEDVAILLAQRNAVRNVLPGQNGMAARWFYSENQDFDDRWEGQVLSDDLESIRRSD